MAFAALGQGGAKTAQPTKSSKVAFILLAPGLIYLGLFFLTPLVSLVITSLKTINATGAIGMYDYALQFSNYSFAVSMYGPQIFRSFVYAFIATVMALVISYPIAYFIGVRARNKPVLQALLLTLVIAPFFISFLLRTFAWKQIFSNESPVTQILQNLAILPPDQNIIGTPFAVIFGLTYNFIPFMVLPIYTSLERLDLRLVEAGSDLYATPAKTFWRVTLPLSTPGVISGTLLTFIPISGDYVNASRDFLGDSGTAMLGNVVESAYFRMQDYPTASALSVMLMAAIVILVSAYVRRSGTEDLL
jgi:spermidine/putrescine transport system permease protein